MKKKPIDFLIVIVAVILVAVVVLPYFSGSVEGGSGGGLLNIIRYKTTCTVTVANPVAILFIGGDSKIESGSCISEEVKFLCGSAGGDTFSIFYDSGRLEGMTNVGDKSTIDWRVEEGQRNNYVINFCDKSKPTQVTLKLKDKDGSLIDTKIYGVS